MKPAGLVAKWWAFGAICAVLVAAVCFLTGHPFLGIYAAGGAVFGFYLSLVMR